MKKKIFLPFTACIVALSSFTMPLVSCNSYNPSTNNVVVSFTSSEGGNLSGDLSITIEKGKTWADVKKPSISIDDGYVFKGWFSNGKQMVDNDIINENIAIVAQFSKKLDFDVIAPTKVDEITEYDQTKDYDETIYSGFKFTGIKQSENLSAIVLTEESEIYGIADIIGFSSQQQTFSVRVIRHGVKLTKVKFRLCFIYNYQTIILPQEFTSERVMNLRLELFNISYDEANNSANINGFNSQYLPQENDRLIIPSKFNDMNGKTWTVNSVGGFISLPFLKTVYIQGCNELSTKAFYECVNLENIIIPQNLKTIPALAFYLDKSLIDPSFIEPLENIGSESFGCTTYKRINFKNAIKLESNAFLKCTNLEEIVFNNNLTTIGERCFSQCNAIKNIYFNVDAEECKKGWATNAFDGAFEKTTPLVIHVKPGCLKNVKEYFNLPEIAEVREDIR